MTDLGLSIYQFICFSRLSGSRYHRGGRPRYGKRTAALLPARSLLRVIMRFLNELQRNASRPYMTAVSMRRSHQVSVVPHYSILLKTLKCSFGFTFTFVPPVVLV